MTIQRIIIEEKRSNGTLVNLYYRNCAPLNDLLPIYIDYIEYKIIFKRQNLDTNKGILEMKYVVEKVNKLTSKTEK